MKNSVYFSFVCFFVCACSGQYNQYKNKCEQTDTINCPSLYFVGFSYPEIQHIFVKQISKNGLEIDSFYIQVNESYYDSVRLKLSVRFPTRDFSTKDTYQFYLKDLPPYVLSNIKTYLKSNYDNFANPVYICEIGSYEVNGITYEFPSPIIMKDPSLFGK